MKSREEKSERSHGALGNGQAMLEFGSLPMEAVEVEMEGVAIYCQSRD